MQHTYEVFASAETPILVAKGKKDTVVVASYKDPENGSVVLTNAMKNVFSPITGGELERASNASEVLSSTDLDELTEVATCSCGAKLLTTASLADKLFGDDLYCVVCGEKIKLDEDEEVDDTDDDEELEVEEDDEEETASEKCKCEKEETEEDESDKDEDSEEDPEVEESCDDEEEIEIDDDENEQPKSEKEEAGDEVDDKDDANSEEVVKETKVEEETSEPDVEESCDEPKDESKEEDSEEEETEVEESCGEPKEAEEVDLEVEEEPEDLKEEGCLHYNCLSSVKNVESVELVKCEAGYRVLVNNDPVATLVKDSIKPELASLKDDVKSLTKALSASVSEEGFSKQVIASFGIKPLFVKINVDEAANQRLNAVEASLKTKYDEEQKAFVERFKQSMTIASAGVNKGLYGANLMSQAIIKCLSASGAVDAEEVVNEIMAKYGEGYLKQIIDKASELVGKSDEVRNETASLVLAADFSKTRSAYTHKAVEPVAETASVVEEQPKQNRYANLF